MNKIVISRINYAPTYTLGFIKHKDFFCFTLEPAKTVGKGCIPCGTYSIVWEYSPRFKCNLWELKDVPKFTEVKVHEGNEVEETDGCILVGDNWASKIEFLGHSEYSLTRFNQLCHDEKITHIEIRDV